MHDTPESVGYRFDDGRSVMAFVTDIGSVTPTVLDAVTGANLAVIEANHDVFMLKNGGYPAYLKRRILSDRGHLSNDDSARLAAALVESGTRQIVLAHLSRENNTPRLAHDTVSTMLGRKGAVIGRDVCLDTAPPDELGSIYII
jgi:phosphoribosyl 1,2-cyclic phosphodiesterase